MNVITLSKLIDLKLAPYERKGVIRIKDLADIVELIKYQNLEQPFTALLDSSARNQIIQLVLDIEEEKKTPQIDDG